MRHRPLELPGAVVLSAALFIAACSDGGISSLAAPEENTAFLSHSPAHHGVSESPALASVTDYAALDGAAARQQGGTLHLTVDASGPIPRFPDSYITSVAVFGYAWADLDTGTGIVSVIHPVIGRDSRQNPDGWHTHPVQLAGGTKPAGTSDFCIVSIGRSQAGIAITGDVMRVHVAKRWAGLSASALDVAAAFVVQEDSGCPVSGLGVAILDAASL